MIDVKVFSAPWCASCGMYKQALTSAGIEVTEYDIEKRPNIAEMYNIKSLPTTIIMKNDAIIGYFTQAVPVQMILNIMEEG